MLRMNEGLTLSKYDFIVKVKWPDNDKLTILKSNMDLYNLMVSYKKNKTNRLGLFVQFNLLNVHPPILLLEHRPHGHVEVETQSNQLET